MDAVSSRLESILFTAGEPVSYSVLAEGLGIGEDDIRRELEALNMHYEQTGSGLRLFLTEAGVQMLTAPHNADAVMAVLAPVQKRTVSSSLLETLAVVAYRQPVTRSDIEDIRGVRCEYAVTQLMKLGLIAQAGRKEVPGRPVLFVTTDTFLRKFNLRSLADLPRREEAEFFGVV